MSYYVQHKVTIEPGTTVNSTVSNGVLKKKHFHSGAYEPFFQVEDGLLLLYKSDREYENKFDEQLYEQGHQTLFGRDTFFDDDSFIKFMVENLVTGSIIIESHGEEGDAWAHKIIPGQMELAEAKFFFTI